MPTLTLALQDIEILNSAKSKLQNRRRLSSKEHCTLCNFLCSLPRSEALLQEQFPLDEIFEVNIFDIEEMWPQLQKWLDLFNNLPKNGSSTYPYANWIDAEEEKNFWRTQAIIRVAFIPSFAYSKKKKGESKVLALGLKIDGTAFFEFCCVKDAMDFPELYRFKGSWKEAYFLLVKTLQQGWPQTKFPEELDSFLKK